MSLVAIIGAGEIGGAAARALAVQGRFNRILLIDEKEKVAAGKALDLMQSGPITRSDAQVEGAADLSAASGADVIVLADAAESGAEWNGDSGLGVLRRLAGFGCLEQAITICAGPAQSVLMQLAFDELGLSRRRVIGSAPESLAATARALVAIEARVAANQVILAVMGKPPDRFVIPWNEASAGGNAVATLLAPPQLSRVERRLRGLWPPGPGSLGTAAALFCGAAVAGSRRIVSAFVSLDRDNGTKAPVCAWPVSIGPKGLERTIAPVLTARDQVVVNEVLQ